jgi:hypothetical protein
LQADFRAIYRLTPAEALNLPGPEYLALAWRCDAYHGAMRARVMQQQEEQAQEENTVAPTREALSADPAFAGMIDWG